MNSFCSLAVTLAISLGGSGAPAPAHKLETVMQDDAEMLARSHAQVRRNARRMADLGVDRVRLTASWGLLAPEGKSERRPRFDATDSREYREETIKRLDWAVTESKAAGLDVMIDLAFFAPRWAVQRKNARDGRHVWRPSVREFGRFSRAIAERYSGRFRAGGRRLPAVNLWTTWNEPNHRTFLRPQWERIKGRWYPASPHIYRRMHNASYDQVKAASSDNRVLIGGLASFGDPGRGPRSGVAPLRFTRELACVDARLRPLRRRACKGFEPLRADGFAHHPYSMDTAPGSSAPSADRVQIGELGKLTALLEQLHKRGRTVRKLALYLTEYGYETNPPDPSGLPPATHARYLGEATYLAWQQPEVRMFPQFLLQDIGPDPVKPGLPTPGWGDYQTGLYHHDGTAKRDVLQSFRLPFHVEVKRDAEGGRQLLAFGQVRPLRGQQRVEIQRLDHREGWVPEASLPAIEVPGKEGCGDFATDGQGFYARRMLFRGTESYRAAWRRADGKVETTPPLKLSAVD